MHETNNLLLEARRTSGVGCICLAWNESFAENAVPPAVGPGDWKVALTRTLESVRYAKQIPSDVASAYSAATASAGSL